MSQQLQHVNVQRNDIRVAGLMALTRALQLSKTLVRLDVDRAVRLDRVSSHVCACMSVFHVWFVKQFCLYARTWIRKCRFVSKMVVNAHFTHFFLRFSPFQQQDQDLVRALMDSIAESTFRNLQRATEVALKKQQEEALQQEEAARETENSVGESPVTQSKEAEHTLGAKDSQSAPTDEDESVFEGVHPEGAAPDRSGEHLSEETTEAALALAVAAAAEDDQRLDECLVSESSLSDASAENDSSGVQQVQNDDENEEPGTPEEEATQPRAGLFSPVADKSELDFFLCCTVLGLVCPIRLPQVAPFACVCVGGGGGGLSLQLSKWTVSAVWLFIVLFSLLEKSIACIKFSLFLFFLFRL